MERLRVVCTERSVQKQLPQQFTAKAGVGDSLEGGLWSLSVLLPFLPIHNTQAGFALTPLSMLLLLWFSC